MKYRVKVVVPMVTEEVASQEEAKFAFYTAIKTVFGREAADQAAFIEWEEVK